MSEHSFKFDYHSIQWCNWFNIVGTSNGEGFTIVWNLPRSPNGVVYSYRIIVENLVNGKNVTNNTSGFNHTYTGLGMSYNIINFISGTLAERISI